MTIAGIMVTNGGVHSAEDWSLMTAGQLLKIDGNSATAGEARKFELRLLELLEARVDAVQKGQRAYLAADPVHVKNPFNIAKDCRIDEQVDAIAALSVGTPFEAHFNSNEIKAYVKEVLLSHFDTILGVERSWYCDNNADNPHISEYRARLAQR